jgi:hypothetical protein
VLRTSPLQALSAATMRDLIAQRLYALACGCENLNDPAPLRTDPLLQTAGGRCAELGSPLFCRARKRASGENR